MPFKPFTAADTNVKSKKRTTDIELKPQAQIETEALMRALADKRAKKQYDENRSRSHAPTP